MLVYYPRLSTQTRGHVEPMTDKLIDSLRARPDDRPPGWDQDFELLLVGLITSYKNILRMIYRDGLKQIEVAERLGVTRQRVDQLHQMALKKLHKILHPKFRKSRCRSAS